MLGVRDLRKNIFTNMGCSRSGASKCQNKINNLMLFVRRKENGFPGLTSMFIIKKEYC